MHYNERTRSTKLVGFMLSGMLFALTTSVYAGSSSTTVNFQPRWLEAPVRFQWIGPVLHFRLCPLPR